MCLATTCHFPSFSPTSPHSWLLHPCLTLCVSVILNQSEGATTLHHFAKLMLTAERLLVCCHCPFLRWESSHKAFKSGVFHSSKKCQYNWVKGSGYQKQECFEMKHKRRDNVVEQHAACTSLLGTRSTAGYGRSALHWHVAYVFQFVDGKPTDEHPYPAKGLGDSALLKKSRYLNTILSQKSCGHCYGQDIIMYPMAIAPRGSIMIESSPYWGEQALISL